MRFALPMLQRKPTRIELKSEDKAEYEAVREERRQAELQAAAQAAGKAPLSPLFVAPAKKPTAAQRIGLVPQ